MKKSFTLVELLVVISIIALLMTLLLPALSTTRQLGRRMACSNNNQQIGRALQMYASDYGDYIPPIITYNTSTIWWQCRLSGYLAAKEVTNYSNASLNRGLPLVFRCPSADQGMIILYCYSLNRDISFSISTAGEVSNTPPRLVSLKKPSRTAALMDGKSGYTGFDYRNRTNPDYEYSSINFIHMNGTNILYADSHVEWRVPKRGYGFGSDVMAQDSTGYTLYE